MAQNVQVCEISEEVKERIKKFRFRKETNNAAIIMKINKDTLEIILDEEFEDCTIDEIQEELPIHQPRFIVYSYVYTHDDGRVSYPLIFIFSTPQACKPEMAVMYAGSRNALVQETGLTKVFEVRSTEELTEEWLLDKLKFFS